MADFQLLTAAEFAALPDPGYPTELVRGRVHRLNYRYPRYGEICGKALGMLGRYLDERDLGHLVGVSGVWTEHDPDTVRRTDLAFYSYERVPLRPMPQGYLAIPPDLAFEIRSPTERWSKVLAKVAEFLEVGVMEVAVLDEQTHTARIYTADDPERIFAAEQVLLFPVILPGFTVRVRKLFE